MPRVNYVMKVTTVMGDACSPHIPTCPSMTSSPRNCTRPRCQPDRHLRSVLGDVVTAMIKDRAELDSVFAAVSNRQHNRYYEGFYTGFYPFIWSMSGLGYAHGANNNNVGTYLNSSARLAIPKLATLHEDLAAAGKGGGGYTSYYWNTAQTSLKVSLTAGAPLRHELLHCAATARHPRHRIRARPHAGAKYAQSAVRSPTCSAWATSTAHLHEQHVRH